MKRALRVQKLGVVIILAAAAVFAWRMTHAAGPLLWVSKPIALALPAKPDPKRLDQLYAKLPMSFEANHGQSDPAVQFLSRGPGYSLSLTSVEAVLVLSKTRGSGAPSLAFAGHESRIEDSRSAVLRMRLGGAVNPLPKVSGEEELPGKSNYFIGNDPAKWRTNVPTYSKVRYSEVYSGIDLMYYGNGRQLEYDFVVAPGANPRAIRLAFDGSSGSTIDRDGDLVLKTGTGGDEVRFRKPVAYQLVMGRRQEVAAEYMVSDAHEVSFKVSRYDVREPLVIDPILSYSTYLGGNGGDSPSAIAVDGSGNAYLTGSTSSTSFPTASPLQPVPGGGGDAFVAKLNATGSALLYSTYLGGSSDDSGSGIAVDGSGNAYLTGRTASINFPTASALQPFFRGIRDAFVAKLNATGSALVYSTYLGGSGLDLGFSIAVDGPGNAYVTGDTFSTDFPTANAFQPVHSAGPGDIFLAKLNPGGSALVYSTYFGGNDHNSGRAVAVDGSGNAYLTGYTFSTNFPTVNPLQPAHGGGQYDAFVSKLNAAGSALVYSTYLGGNSLDQGLGIAGDGSGNAYVTGETVSTNFPTAHALQPAIAGGVDDGFVAKVNAAGTTLLYSTYLGGTGGDWGNDIAVDSSGNAYVTGFTESIDFPTANPLQPANGGGGDAFIAKLNADGSALLYATYLGGNGGDQGIGIAVDGSGNAYVTGFTASTNFPTANALQPANGGGGDTFVAKISSANPPDCGQLGFTPVANLLAPIFPLDHGMRAVTITGVGPNIITNICQDEDPNFENIPAYAIDGSGIGTAIAGVRAERSGTRATPGNGRVYHIYFSAPQISCNGQVTVDVPLVFGGTAVDDGPIFNSVRGGSCGQK